MTEFQIINIKNLTEAEFKKAFEGMSKERQTKCLRYKFTDDRRRMAFGEELLKKLIASKFNAEGKSISLKHLSSGKPVAFVNGKEVFVSVSHSGDFVACAVSSFPVGIDIEVVREIGADFIERFLSEEELDFVRNGKGGELSFEERMRFLQVWTAKEAYLKLTGVGLKGLNKADVLPLIKSKSAMGLTLKSFCTKEYACTLIVKD